MKNKILDAFLESAFADAEYTLNPTSENKEKSEQAYEHWCIVSQEQ